MCCNFVNCLLQACSLYVVIGAQGCLGQGTLSPVVTDTSHPHFLFHPHCINIAGTFNSGLFLSCILHGLVIFANNISTPNMSFVEDIDSSDSVCPAQSQSAFLLSAYSTVFSVDKQRRLLLPS